MVAAISWHGGDVAGYFSIQASCLLYDLPLALYAEGEEEGKKEETFHCFHLGSAVLGFQFRGNLLALQLIYLKNDGKTILPNTLLRGGGALQSLCKWITLLNQRSKSYL